MCKHRTTIIKSVCIRSVVAHTVLLAVCVPTVNIGKYMIDNSLEWVVRSLNSCVFGYP